MHVCIFTKLINNYRQLIQLQHFGYFSWDFPATSYGMFALSGVSLITGLEYGLEWNGMERYGIAK